MRIDELRHKADDRLRNKVKELSEHLQQTETKLAELQTKRGDQMSLSLSPEQEAAIKQFNAEKTRIRKELRETQRSLDVDIEHLQTWLKIINIGLMPLLVAAAGIFGFVWRRRKHGMGAAT